ncbi:MAG: hypothetical protein LIP04_11115 [Tannerellaceae bacterium]|nr:hypothetical protein [Tannerellaceae bacterium]
MKDGLSQEDRRKRIDSVEPFMVIDHQVKSLIRQAVTLAGCIRYYTLTGKKEGDFSRFFDLTEDLDHRDGTIKYDGEMEPAKALLLTFLHQLHIRTGKFNNRWENYINWYMDQCLQILPQPSYPDSTWLTFTRNTSKPVLIRKQTGFTCREAKTSGPVIYRTTEPVAVTNVTIANLYALHFDRNPHIYPACLFHIPTALTMKNIGNGQETGELLFEDRINPEQTKPVGLSLSSPPILLLREGKRFISITFETEQETNPQTQHRRNLVRLLQNIEKESAPINRENAKEVLFLKIFSDIFYIEISTATGWTPVEKYVIRQRLISPENRQQGLTLSLELPEEFPSTSSCYEETHQQKSADPVIRLLLNRNAWLYPWSWLKDFLIARISIQVEV